MPLHQAGRPRGCPRRQLVPPENLEREALVADKAPSPPPPAPVQPELPAQPAPQLEPEPPLAPPAAADPMLERFIQALERREPTREAERERDAGKIRSQLRQMGIVDFHGDFDPEETDEWLKNCCRNMICYN